MDLFGSKGVVLRVGEKQADKKGPVLFYFHGTGSFAAEMSPSGRRRKIRFSTRSRQKAASRCPSTTVGSDPSNNTGNDVWYTDDYAVADRSCVRRSATQHQYAPHLRCGL